MSQEMHEFLAAYYGTAPQPSAEEVQRAQQIDFFAKTAAANGIDLEALNQDQINWLWNQVFTTKTAEPAKEEKAPPAEKKEEKDEAKDKAEAEFAQKKEAMAKIAEADFLGRVMAHSFYNESVKIASAQPQEKAAEFPPKKDEEPKKEEKKDEGDSLKDRLMAAAKKDESKEEEKKEEKKASVSDLDAKAAELAVQKLASSNYWDVNEGVERLHAVLTLGPKESVKVASAPNFEAALDIRALELLELAGYPIEWKS